MPERLRAVPRRGPHRTRRRRRPGARRQDRAAPRTLGQRPTRRGRTRPCRQRRLARRLRLHQGPRRAGADRGQGPGAGLDRAPVDHRVGARRAEARLDPRVPHGRAGAHLLRPRSARRVPRRPRGHRRRDPGRPRRRRRSSPSPPSARNAPRRSPRSRPAASTRSSTGMLVDNVSGWFLEHPIYDAKGQPIVVPEFRFPGRGRVQAQLERAKKVLTADREGAPEPPAARQAGRVVGAGRDQAGRGRAGAHLRRAVRPLHRVRGDLPGRQPDAHVGRTQRRRPGRRSTSTPGRSTGRPTSPRSTCPSIVQHARVKTTPGPARVDRPHGPHAQAGARPRSVRSWRSTSRTR